MLELELYCIFQRISGDKLLADFLLVYFNIFVSYTFVLTNCF